MTRYKTGDRVRVLNCNDGLDSDMEGLVFTVTGVNLDGRATIYYGEYTWWVLDENVCMAGRVKPDYHTETLL